MGTNIRKILDTIEYLSNEQKTGILLFLDFEKAFDTVEWSFLFKVLEKFNFGNQFINWIKLLYKEPTATFKNNGWLSEKIKLKRGIRQGCPVSALLFILVVEILAINLKDSNYKGISFQNANSKVEMKLSQYADDLTLILSDYESISTCINTIKDFSQVAGHRINLNKTEGLLIGALKHSCNTDYMGIKMTNEFSKILGIYIGNDKMQCEAFNWNDKIKKVQAT